MTPINLAPNHKHGLNLSNPVMLAGGVIGNGDTLLPGFQTEKLGGVVVGPVMQHSRAGAEPPRLAETNGGFVLNTDLQNRGISRVLKRFAHTWPRLGCPVIIQIADTQPGSAATVIQRLMDHPTAFDTVVGVELLLPEQARNDSARTLIESVVRHSDLPICVKLPLERAVELASVAVQAGADTLVVAQPPTATLYHDSIDMPNQSKLIRGSLFGPLAFASMLNRLVEVAALSLPCALIACGGIHTAEQATQALMAGADALQVDCGLWVEPSLAVQIVERI